MSDKANIKQATMWSSKPVKMNYIGAWEIDKTPPDCIPRLCSLNIHRLTLTKSLSHDVTAIKLGVKMQNFKRILRSNEITVPPHSDTTSSTIDIEIDLSFSFQYPHFLKRNCNYLQIILQRRKKYKNKAILGFKTLACGLIDMSEVLQRSTINERELDLLGHVKDSGKNEVLARLKISPLKCQPVDQESNSRRGKVSIDRADVYSDEDDFTSAEDGSDSETIEDGNVRDRFNQFRRKLNERKARKQFSNNDKFNSVVPSNVQQRNLKQRFISLLKKFRLPDSEAYDSEEKFQEALEKELMASSQDPPDIDEFFDDEDIDDLDDLSDSGQEFDDVSISSTPKPSLRPFFSSCTLVGQDKLDEFQKPSKKFDYTDSQENSGTEQTADNSDTSQKHSAVEEQQQTPQQQQQPRKKANSNEKETKRAKLFSKDKENRSFQKEKKPVSASLSISSATFSKDDYSPKEFILDQLNRIFMTEEQSIPDEIVFISMGECANAQQLIQLFERTHHIIGTNSVSDVKFSFNYLCNKVQKFCNSNLKTPFPIKLALIGSDAYINSFLRFYVESLSSKSPDWQNYLRFYIIPSNNLNSYSSSVHKYLASIDSAYSNYFLASKDESANSSSANDSTTTTAVTAHELYTKTSSFLKNAQTLLQIPIAEAMVTYKDKSVDEESNQVFIPFICDAKIGSFDTPFANHSMEEDPSFSASPPGQSGSTDKPSSISKDQHPTTPPNSPSISASQPFHQSTSTPKEQHKDISPAEAIDLQIDYWILQSKLNDVSNKKNDSCKFTMKNTFRNVQISRLPVLGEINSPSLTLFYVTKEKKQKIMRLGKKKEKDGDTKCQMIDSIFRLVCLYKATQSPLKVTIDGVELSGVKFFQLSTQWQTQIKFFPVVIFSLPDTVLSPNSSAASALNSSTGLNSYKTPK